MSEPTSALKLRVLVVEDNADAAQSLAMLLALWGHETQVAHNGHAALSGAAAFRPDLALLDLGLPRMDGYEVARRLRELPGLANVVLVALTGFTDEQHRRRSDGAGFAYYLIKPADLGELEALLGVLAREKANRAAG
jgi:two-component system CheB/CheR fusion protein